jgi:hypothetical protein
VYFIDPERKPLGSAPTAASFQPRDRKAATIPLNPTQDSDPSKAGGLASSPIDEPGDIVGTLSATIDRQPVSISISIR